MPSDTERPESQPKSSGWLQVVNVILTPTLSLLIVVALVLNVFAYAYRPFGEFVTNVISGLTGGSRGDCPDNAIQQLRRPGAQNIRARILSNKATYEAAAQEHNIPWEMLAAIHYREHGNDPSSPSNGEGSYQMTTYSITLQQQSSLTIPYRKTGNKTITRSDLNDFATASSLAANLLQEKVRHRLTANPSDSVVRDAFWGYNGRARWHGSANGSAYVMNNFDTEHQRMRIRGTVDNGRVRVDVEDTRDGAYTVYYLLRYLATFEGGDITFKDCAEPVQAGGGDVLAPSEAGSQIVAIAERHVGETTHIDPETGENSFQCSVATRSCASFVSTVLIEAGVMEHGEFAGNTTGVWNHPKGRVIIDRGSELDLSKLQPGDVVWFGLGDRARYAGALFNHVGIYIGNGMIIDTSSSQRKVVKRSITAHQGSNRFAAAKRFSP